MAHTNEKIIGIDLGTTNSCVAVMQGNEPFVIPNEEGNRTTPSIAAFTDKGERKVGAPAKRQAITNPERTIYSAKRFIGRAYDDVADLAKKMPFKVTKDSKGSCAIAINGNTYTPQEISAMVLTKLKTAAKDYLGTEVKKAVVTVPAYFTDSQRQATKEAGEIAGLEVVRIINEPTAAALAYGLDKLGKEEKERTIAVYDLGGGTFDISILEISEGVFQVKATNGDATLGGDNFDEKIMEWLVDDFRTKEDIDLRKDPAALQRLKEAAEKAKIELSSGVTAEINLPFIAVQDRAPKHLVATLSRAKFEELCDSLFRRTLEPCRQAMKAAKCTQVDEVILVGGSTRIPRIQAEVEKLFGKTPCKGVNPDEVVAMGAAIQGSVLAGTTAEVLLLDVTPFSLGIETLGGVATKVIEANTTIPTKKSQLFSTAEDNQTSVEIHVLQGEREMAKYNRTLGRFHLEGIPAAPKGAPQVEVTFDIDANGIVHVSAKDKKTNKEQKIRIEASANLSREEIQKMKEEEARYVAQDKREKELADKRNKAHALLYQVEKQLKEVGAKLDLPTKERLQAATDTLRKALDQPDIAAVEESTQALETALKEAASELMKAASATAPQKETPAGEASQEADVQEAEFEEVSKE